MNATTRRRDDVHRRPVRDQVEEYDSSDDESEYEQEQGSNNPLN